MFSGVCQKIYFGDTVFGGINIRAIRHSGKSFRGNDRERLKYLIIFQIVKY